MTVYLSNPAFTHHIFHASDPADASFLHHFKVLDELYFNNREMAHWEYRFSIELSKMWLSFITLVPSETQTGSSGNFERIRTLISFVHTNYKNPLSVQDIADAAHISKTECVRCFQRFVHTSPYQYLIRYRLHMSTAALASSAKSVTEIALETGFHSASVYIKYFKQSYQITPHQYRKSFRNQ